MKIGNAGIGIVTVQAVPASTRRTFIRAGWGDAKLLLSQVKPAVQSLVSAQLSLAPGSALGVVDTFRIKAQLR